MKRNAIALSLISTLMLLTSCSLITGIFKAGVWVGVIVVVVVVALIIFVISKIFGGGGD